MNLIKIPILVLLIGCSFGDFSTATAQNTLQVYSSVFPTTKVIGRNKPLGTTVYEKDFYFSAAKWQIGIRGESQPIYFNSGNSFYQMGVGLEYDTSIGGSEGVLAHARFYFYGKLGKDFENVSVTFMGKVSAQKPFISDDLFSEGVLEAILYRGITDSKDHVAVASFQDSGRLPLPSFGFGVVWANLFADIELQLPVIHKYKYDFDRKTDPGIVLSRYDFVNWEVEEQIRFAISVGYLFGDR